MVDINPIKKVTLTEQITKLIASWIMDGKLNPGEKLPNERELAERLGVNRGRVRESLRALAIVGLITIKPGQGSFVNEKNESIPADTIIWLFHAEVNNFIEIYEARKLIESEIYLKAAPKLDNENRTILNNLVNELKRIVDKDKDNFIRYQDTLDKFDLCMADWSGNKIYEKLMQQIIYLRRNQMVKILNVPGALKNSLESRITLVKAIVSNDHKLKEIIEQIYKDTEPFYQSLES